jgi:hypothetical protein
MPKIRKAIYIEAKHLYRSVSPPHDQLGQVLDSGGQVYNIRIPENAEYSDLMVIEKDSEMSPWKKWTMVVD